MLLRPKKRAGSSGQEYLCEAAALFGVLVQLFSLLGNWVLHGLSADTNCLGHKTGSVLHFNLRYTILGDCEGEESFRFCSVARYVEKEKLASHWGL